MSALFITGSTGFVGSHFLPRTKETQYDSVYCLVRDPRAVQEMKAKDTNTHMIYGRLTDVELYAPYLRHTSTVIHLAAATGKAPREEYFAKNTR